MIFEMVQGGEEGGPIQETGIMNFLEPDSGKGRVIIKDVLINF